MRAVVQRVKDCSVSVDGEVTGSIDDGLLVYLGISSDDSKDDVVYLSEKVANLRIFNDENGKMNLSAADLSVGGAQRGRVSISNGTTADVHA